MLKVTIYFMGRVLIVGGTKGIGRSCVSAFQAQFQVDVMSRSTQIPCNVTELRKLKQIMIEYRSRTPKLDALILCAGGLNYGPRRVTAEGVEVTFAQNYLSRFLIIQELLPILKGGTVVNVLGAGNGSKLNPNDLQLQRPAPWIPFFIQAAGTLATLTDLVTMELQKRNPQTQFYHLFPGVVNTSNARNQGFPPFICYIFEQIAPLFAKDPSKVASLIFQMATTSNITGPLVGPNGQQIQPSKFGGLTDEVWKYTQALCDSF
jgi:NAD(P)-dependent dehydrogenase (short-subunit alcohol dehydrogenase family)